MPALLDRSLVKVLATAGCLALVAGETLVGCSSTDQSAGAGFNTGGFGATPVGTGGSVGGSTPSSATGAGSGIPSGAAGGTVACLPGQALCGGVCVQTMTDAANCGTCGTICSFGMSCVAGSCSCPQAMTACTDGCVDTSQDPNNCGSCGTVCLPGSACVSGACQCQAGLTECAGTCVNTQSDASHCGGCGLACASGQVCSAGSCGSSCTVPGQTLCGSSCVDTNSDSFNCGVCGQVCAGGATCTGGVCGCPAGQAMCSGQCVAVASDSANCGGCGITCTGGQVCTNGSCGCANAGEVVCGSSCINVTTDANNCGSCGVVCAAGQSCSNGVCVGGGTGGAGTGGQATGGVSTGGQPTGGGGSGGWWSTGGVSTGGVSTGGVSTGGVSTGGVSTGGTSTGGSGTTCGCSSITNYGTVNSTIVVASGETYDGGCKRYIANASTLGDGSSAEGQDPVFLLEDGATLRNVVLGSPAADGIHTEGDATLYNIHWEDIGEDAMTIKASGTVTLDCGSSTNGDDKTFQVNAASTFRVSNFKASNAGKFCRQNGGTTFTMHLYIDNCDISNMGNCIYQTDSSSSTVSMTNTRYSDIGDALFIGVSSGNITQSNNTEY